MSCLRVRRHRKVGVMQGTTHTPTSSRFDVFNYQIKAYLLQFYIYYYLCILPTDVDRVYSDLFMMTRGYKRRRERLHRTKLVL